MKKIISFLIALCIFTTGVASYNWKLDENLNKKVFSNENAVNNVGFIVLSDNDGLNSAMLKNNTLLVMGSSELHPATTIELEAFPPTLYNKENYDFNVVLLGKGYTQSLWHAIELAAISDKIKNKKVAFIISPQWFTEEGVNSAAFASLFSAKTYYQALNNNKLSDETKTYIKERTEALLQNSGNINLLDSTYENKDFIGKFGNSLYNFILDIRSKKETLEVYGEIEEEQRKEVTAEKIDYSEYMQSAEKLGEKYCTNNEFGIFDEYYTTYIQEDVEELKGSYSERSFCISPEYNDLKLFLQVCQESGIEPLLISIPVNGRWYDYAGFPKMDREQYYQNIRDIAADFDVELADFSDKEYEKYFLGDIMHLGWKGWVYLDESFYKFYKEN
ncbi:MAG: D-alanyl-lipoteichoic acid biosynthesis protein DltD [Clostridiales bacterium]|nr:D-alanyl-lipoteichoic acid biosynthesis protein DltD [Clostridiales bacterium]